METHSSRTPFYRENLVFCWEAAPLFPENIYVYQESTNSSTTLASLLATALAFALGVRVRA